MAGHDFLIILEQPILEKKISEALLSCCLILSPFGVKTPAVQVKISRIKPE